MCEFLASLIIVGAVEIEPEWMMVQYMEDNRIEEVFFPTAVYQECIQEPNI